MTETFYERGAVLGILHIVSTILLGRSNFPNYQMGNYLAYYLLFIKNLDRRFEPSSQGAHCCARLSAFSTFSVYWIAQNISSDGM